MKHLKDFIFETNREMFKKAALKQNEILINMDLTKISKADYDKLIKRRDDFLKHYIDTNNKTTIGKFINSYLKNVGSKKTLDNLTKTELKKYLGVIYYHDGENKFNGRNLIKLGGLSKRSKGEILYDEVIQYFKDNKDLECFVGIELHMEEWIHSCILFMELSDDKIKYSKNSIGFYFDMISNKDENDFGKALEQGENFIKNLENDLNINLKDAYEILPNSEKAENKDEYK